MPINHQLGGTPYVSIIGHRPIGTSKSHARFNELIKSRFFHLGQSTVVRPSDINQKNRFGRRQWSAGSSTSGPTHEKESSAAMASDETGIHRNANYGDGMPGHASSPWAASAVEPRRH